MCASYPLQVMLTYTIYLITSNVQFGMFSQNSVTTVECQIAVAAAVTVVAVAYQQQW